MKTDIVNLSALPKLPLTDKRLLPSCPAVYFVIQEDTVLYIGKAVNLAQRWGSHQRWYQLKDRQINGTIYIAWLECDETKCLELIEAAMINLINPALNKRRTMSSPKTGRETRTETSKEWISLSRLATILGVTPRSLQKRVKGQDWNPRRKREERGGGWEYHISGLPEDIQCRISAVN